jgi:hypothetical protein
VRETIGTRELEKFLGVSQERLRTWINWGVFGEDKVGVGPGPKGRQFNAEEVLLACVVRELLDLTRYGHLQNPLFRELRDAVNDLRKLNPGRVSWNKWLALTWTGAEFRITPFRQEESPSYESIAKKIGRKVFAFIIVPLHLFVDEVREFFERPE